MLPISSSRSIFKKSTEDIATLGNLVDRIGYKLTSFTEKEFIEEFDDAFHLMDYLSQNGMGFAGKDARDTVLKDLFLSTSSIYEAMFARSYEKPVSPGAARWGETEKAKTSKIANAPGPSHGGSVIPATFHII